VWLSPQCQDPAEDLMPATAPTTTQTSSAHCQREQDRVQWSGWLQIRFQKTQEISSRQPKLLRKKPFARNARHKILWNKINKNWSDLKHSRPECIKPYLRQRSNLTHTMACRQAL
jgi:hypothetical protein